MSINACTLESSSVNVFCSPRRALVVNRLINELHPPKKTVKGGNPGPVNRWTGFKQEEPTFTPVERPQILVRSWFETIYGEERRDNMATMPIFVFVNDLNFGHEQEVKIRVMNLKINDHAQD